MAWQRPYQARAQPVRRALAMWLIFTRTPHPEAVHWPGRRWFAAADAVAWPAMWVAVVAYVPGRLGAVGLVACAWAAWSCATRLQRAVFVNRRYRFTTWQCGRCVIGVLMFGALLKLASTF